MMLIMSSTNGGFERRKVRLVLVDEFLSLYKCTPVKTAARPLLEQKCTCSAAADPSLDRTVIVVFDDDDGGLLL